MGKRSKEVLLVDKLQRGDSIFYKMKGCTAVFHGTFRSKNGLYMVTESDGRLYNVHLDELGQVFRVD